MSGMVQKLFEKTDSSGSIRNSDECQADVDMSGAENVDPSRPKKHGRIRRANNVKPSNAFKKGAKHEKSKSRESRNAWIPRTRSTIYVTEQTPSIDIWSPE